MADYPNTLPEPDVQGFEESPAIDPTLRSEMESGKRITRSRFTKIPKKWRFQYTQLSNDNKNTLKSFEESVSYGSDSFDWTHPIDDESHSVRFAEPVKYVLSDSDNREWDVTVILEEV
jgi:hypothetical protein